MKRMLIAAAAAALVLSGCAGTDEDEAGGTPEATAAAAGTIEVTAVDYGYTGLRSTAKAGVKLELTNSSSKEVHEIVAVKLPADEKRPVTEIAKLPQAEMEALGAPATVVIALPGKEGVAAEGDGTLTEPGRYFLGCLIPTGADPKAYEAAMQNPQGGPPDVEGGPPHITQGMIAEITIT